MEWPPRWNIPPHLIMQSPPDQLTQQPSGREPNAIFQRLKWSVLDPPSEAQIFGPDDQGVLQWRPLFDESNKTIVEESAMDPPHSRLEVSIEPLQSWWHWHDAGIQHLRPALALIENPDEQPISVKQFIEALYDYAVPLRNLLLRCTDIRDKSKWDSARFHFDGMIGGSEAEVPGEPSIAINVVEDPMGDGEDCAWVWKDIETRFKNDAAL